MKVVNVQPFDYFSSIQRRSLQVALRLREEGIETIFVTPKEEFFFSRVALQNGFKVYKTKSLRPVFLKDRTSLSHMSRWLGSFPGNILDMYRIDCIEAPDLIQINGFICLQEAMATAIYSRRRFLWHLIGTTIYPRSLLAAFMPLIRSASERVFVAKKLVRYFFCKATDVVIHEPVDHNDICLDKVDYSKANSLREKLSINHGPIVGSIAFISPQKGLEFLLRSIALVKPKIPNVRLIVVGGTNPHQKNYYQSLHNMVKDLGLADNVSFTGHVKREDISLLLSTFDVFVSSSVCEGTPVTILEAMTMGLPVVATNVGGVEEQVINGKTGLLVPPKDPKALAQAIQNVLENQQLRFEMGKRAKARVQAVFSLEKCISLHKQLYLKIAPTKGEWRQDDLPS